MSDTASNPEIARLREQLLLSQARIAELEAELESAATSYGQRLEHERALTSQAQQLADRNLAAAADFDNIAAQLREAETELSAARSRLAESEAGLLAMQQSRSWRWTGWLRSVEQRFSRKQ